MNSDFLFRLLRVANKYVQLRFLLGQRVHYVQQWQKQKHNFQSKHATYIHSRLFVCVYVCECVCVW